MIEITDRITRRQLHNFRKYLNILAELSLDTTPDNLNKMAGTLSLVLEYWAEVKNEAVCYAPDLDLTVLAAWMNNLDGSNGQVDLTFFVIALRSANQECEKLVAQITPPLN